jgi:6-phosphogluconolactonase
MRHFELIRFANDQELADSVSRRWWSELEARGGGRGNYTVALSGGRIAGRLFSTLAELARDKSEVLQAVHWFWGDERCVPPGDPESNFGLAQRLLLQALSVPEGRVHRIRGEELPATAAAMAEAELRSVASAGAGNQPVLDLIFLGMGEDGHVASLFPTEPESMVNDAAVFRAVVGTKPPPNRITIGYQTIAAAREVWVLASGAGKEQALRESTKQAGQTPLARVLRLRSQTTVFTDVRLT